MVNPINYVDSTGNCTDANVTGIEGLVVGFAYGLQYSQHTFGPCYQSLEMFGSLLSELVNGL